MELLQLKYFCKVAETEHLSRAADELMISTPALSHTIKKLEKEVGTPLFDHVGRGIALNEAGKLYYNYVKNALLQLERAHDAVEELAFKKYKLRIAISNPMYWDDLFAAYRKSHPQIKLIVFLVQDIKMWNDPDLKIDFYLGNAHDFTRQTLKQKSLFPEEKPLLIVNKNHRLAKYKNIDLSACENETFFTLHNTNFSMAMWQDLMLRLAGLKNIQLEEGSYLARMRKIHNNSCIGLSTSRGYQLDFMPDKDIVAVPIIRPYVPRQQAISWDENITLKPYAQNFLDFTVDFCQREQV